MIDSSRENRSNGCGAAYRKSNAVVTFGAARVTNLFASLGGGSAVARGVWCKAEVFVPSLTALGRIDRIAYVAHRMNERRIADFSSQASYKNLHQLGVVFVRVFPDPFA